MSNPCKGRCLQIKVPFRPFMNMYLDHVRCVECEAYFKKPYPDTCICCQTKVRHKARVGNKKRVYAGRPPIKHAVNFVKREILAAVADGRL